MYRVLYNGYPLHDLRSEDLRLREPEVHLAVGEAGEMSFVIGVDHPHAGKLKRIKGVVELYGGAVRLFRGRIRKDTQDFYLDRKIEVEGLLACLNDSVIPPFNFPEDFQSDAAYKIAAESGNVVEFFLRWVLDQHNAQTGPDQQIQLGTVTVADPNNFISRSSTDFLTSMEVVHKKLEELLGGYLLADYSGEATVLHYYADLPLTNVQEVEFGENLLDLETELDDVDTYTAILPVGKDGLTIESLPDAELSPGIFKSGRIIYSQSAEDAAGGRITRKVDWNDVTLPENLRTKAAAELATVGVKSVRTITAKAVDLGGENNIPHFVVGRYVSLKSAPHGYADAYPLMELEPNILNPGDTEIVLGSTVLTLTGINNSNRHEQQEQVEEVKQGILDRTDTALDDLRQSMTEQQTAILRDCESIILSALTRYVETGNFDEYKQTVEAQLQIMSDGITASFTDVTQQITNVNGDLQATIEKLEKHFEFNVDGLTIHAGENSMTLILDNDEIQFVKNGQTFGWWDGIDFHTGNIIIGVEERAQFGDFAFIPRTNGGMDFLKVGG